MPRTTARAPPLRTACELRYLPADAVEDAVSEQWQFETVPAEDVALLREQFMADLTTAEGDLEKETATWQQRVHRIKRERFKWAEKAMEGVVPDDIAAEKQQQLASQLAQAEANLIRAQRLTINHREVLEAVLTLIAACGHTYQAAPATVRRAFNQAWFTSLDIDEDQQGSIRVAEARRADVLEAIRTARPRGTRAGNAERGSHVDFRAWASVGGLNVDTLVELRGLEPLTPSMPWRCATSCATAPPPPMTARATRES